MSDQVDWRPSAAMEMIRARAELLGRIREFFRLAGVLEVETPACSRYGVTDPAIDSLSTRYTGPGAAQGLNLYLQTSPEFPMKRLLAAGSGPIYQLCRVFRDGELGRRHNPEFTLLEWYRPGFDHLRLMHEVAALIGHLAGRPMAQERLSYGEAFQRYLGIDPHAADSASLQRCAVERGVPGADELHMAQRDGWLDLLLSHLIEPHLGRDGMTFIYDYPASQAALARIRPGNPPLAERFELYLDGMEIANGFHELADAQEQRRRFLDDNRRRHQAGRPAVPMDEALLAALASGLPDCAGVALGVDRLLMSLTGSDTIGQVLAFDLNRA
jgi:elongation factor P--(R)-beta-lysine ligase